MVKKKIPVKVLSGRVLVTKSRKSDGSSKRSSVIGVWHKGRFYGRMSSYTAKGKRAVTSKVRLAGRKKVYGYMSTSRLSKGKRSVRRR